MKQYRGNRKPFCYALFTEADRQEAEAVLGELEKHRNKVDFIITHCAPRQVASTAGYYDDNTLVQYLDGVADKVDFKRWFFGHYHENRQILTKYIMLYEQIVRIW